MERIAWVAQALLITWLAKKTSVSNGLSVALLSDSSARHLKRKIKPCTGLQEQMPQNEHYHSICSKIRLMMRIICGYVLEALQIFLI